MTTLDDILREARSPGAFVERRRFSLRRDQAVETLRAFTLRRPGQAVLELIQGAVMAGASYIAVETTRDQLVVAWVGAEPLQEEELAHLFDYLFVDRGNRARRPLVQLAVAINALLRTSPASIRITSGTGVPGQTIDMEVQPDGTGKLGSPSHELAGTFVSVRHSRKWRWWGGQTFTEEHVLVEEQCRHTPVPILLNGAAPFGYRANRAIRLFAQSDDVVFDEGPGGRRGALYLVPGESFVDIVIGGVRITTLSLVDVGVIGGAQLATPGALGVCGVVCDDDLRKTADQSDIVRDERFAAMVEALVPHVERLARRLGRPLVRGAGTVKRDADGAASVAEEVRQVAPRGRLMVPDLARLGAEVPLVCVSPAAAVSPALVRALDPVRYPYPVLVLTPDARAAVARRIGRALSALTDVGDVAHAVQRAGGGNILGRAVVSASLPNGQRIHAGQLPPGQGGGLVSPGAVPVFWWDGQQTTAVTALHLPLPDVWVQVWGAQSDEALDVDAFLRAVGPAWVKSPALSLALRVRVLATVLRMPAVGGPLAIETPANWQMDDLPVAPSAMLRAVSEGDSIPVSRENATALAPIEQVVGAGALHVEGRERLVVSVVLVDGRWIPGPSAVSLPLVPTLGPAPLLGLVTSTRVDAAPMFADMPFLVRRGPEPASAAFGHDGLDALLVCLRAAEPVDWRERELCARAVAWVSRVLGTAGSPGRRRLACGPVPVGGGGSVRSWAMAGAEGHREALQAPAWVASPPPDALWGGESQGRGWSAWAGLPSVEEASNAVPSVFWGDGLRWRTFAPPAALPCIAVIRGEGVDEQVVASVALDVWMRALHAPDAGRGHPWIARVTRPDLPSILFRAKVCAAFGRGGPSVAAEEQEALRALVAISPPVDGDMAPLATAQELVLRRCLGR